MYSLGAVSNFTVRRSMQTFSHSSDRKFPARRARTRVLLPFDELRFGNSKISPIVFPTTFNALTTSTGGPQRLNAGVLVGIAIPVYKKLPLSVRPERSYTEHVADLGSRWGWCTVK